MTIPAKKLVVCLVMVLPSISIAQEHTGIVIDATTSHIIVTGRMTPANSAAARRDPRIRQLLRRHVALDEQYISTGRTSTLADDFDILGAKVAPETTITVQGQTTQVTENRKIDWSVPLGTGNVAPHQSPSKYGFNTNDQPDCVNDWVVFGLNVAGVTGGQANLVGINKLYSGVNPTGLCGATGRLTTRHLNCLTGGGTSRLLVPGRRQPWRTSAAATGIKWFGPQMEHNTGFISISAPEH